MKGNEKNEENVARIRAALVGLFGRTCEHVSKRGIRVFRLSREETEVLLGIAPDKVVSAEFLTALTASQLDLFIETSLDGDGTRSRAGQVTWAQSDQARVNMFQMACALAGRATVARSRGGSEWSKKERLNVEILRKTMFNVRNATRLTEGSLYDKIDYQGVIWCPSLPSGTWLARRNGTVYFTGNTVINRLHRDMTNAILRTPAHVYATAGQKAMGEKIEKETRLIFGPLGVMPSGQKNLAHIFHTVLLKKQTRGGAGGSEVKWTMTTAKDRGRVMMDDTEVGDVAGGGFTVAYLVKCAGWKMA